MVLSLNVCVNAFIPLGVLGNWILCQIHEELILVDGEHAAPQMTRPGKHTTETPGARAACLGRDEGGLGRNHAVVFLFL